MLSVRSLWLAEDVIRPLLPVSELPERLFDNETEFVPVMLADDPAIRVWFVFEYGSNVYGMLVPLFEIHPVDGRVAILDVVGHVR